MFTWVQYYVNKRFKGSSCTRWWVTELRLFGRLVVFASYHPVGD